MTYAHIFHAQDFLILGLSVVSALVVGTVAGYRAAQAALRKWYG